MTNFQQEFDGKVAIIAGGGSGIGRASAEMLAARGAKVVVTDVNGEAAETVASAIKNSGGEAVGIALDVTNDDQTRAAVDLAVSTFGGLHLALNSAGIASEGKRFGEIDLNDWNRVIGVDLSGVAIGMNRQIPAIEASGGGGAIVNIASIAGIQGTANNASYVAAKHGVIGVTRAAAMEGGPRGIRVNAVCPGYITTPLSAFAPASFVEASSRKTPMRRWGTADEVAELVAFLLSDRASYMTGGYHVIDGGFTGGYSGALE